MAVGIRTPSPPASHAMALLLPAEAEAQRTLGGTEYLPCRRVYALLQ